MKSAFAGGIFLLIALPAIGCHAAPVASRAGDSMLPSIDIGARLEVSKLEGDPARGRVIVFRAPEAPDREYVKRVVGLPGDTLSVDGTAIVLNGTPIPRCLVGAWSYAGVGGKLHSGDLWLEALADSKWLVFHDSVGGSGPKGPWTVAPGEVFVLGDNRENSHDSRLWFGGKGGGLPLRFIVGSAPVGSTPTLPNGAEPLAPALEGCKARLS